MKTQILLACSLFFFISARAQVVESDSLALVSFYNATGGTEWLVDSNWLSDSPVSQWHGVYIDNQRVTDLYLYNNNLTGSIPDAIGDLTALRNFSFTSNALTGTIPAALGNCPELNSIDLSDNALTGNFPAEIANCQMLTEIIVYRNELSGAFPEILTGLPNLQRLELNSNNFSGAIPASLGNATKLRLLGLDRNEFSGQMPSLKNLTEMVEVHLRENELEGDIADIFNYCPNMYYLTMGDNNFTGCVSDSFFNPAKLQFLDFQQNNFTCLGDFSAFADTGVLKRLTLSYNQIPFEDIEPNRFTFTFNYSPQEPLLTADTLVMEAGDSTEIQSGSLGLYTQYTWFRNGEEIPGANDPTLWVKAFDETKAGVYHCVMTNDSLPLLTLERNPVTLVPDGTSSIQNPETIQLDLRPNPVSDFLYLPSGYSSGQLYIYDQTGRAFERGISINGDRIDVTSLSPGMYTLLIQTEDAMATGQFLKIAGR